VKELLAAIAGLIFGFFAMAFYDYYTSICRDENIYCLSDYDYDLQKTIDAMELSEPSVHDEFLERANPKDFNHDSRSE